MKDFAINIRIRNYHIAIVGKGHVIQWRGIGRLRFSRNPFYEKDWSFFAIYR